MAAPVGDYGVLWTHQDSRGFAQALPMAINRALGLDPQTGAPPPAGVDLWSPSDMAATADMRALLVGTLWLCAQASRTPPTNKKTADGSPATLIQEPTSDADFATGDIGVERMNVAHALITTFSLIHQVAQWRGYPGADLKNIPTKFSTRDGYPATTGQSVQVVEGWQLIAAGVVVVGILAYAGVSAYSSYQTAESQRVVSTEATRRLIVHHANVMEMYGDHLDAEAKAGKQLPLSDAEKSILDNLNKAAELVYDNEQKSLKKVGETAKPDLLAGVKDIGMIAVVVIGLWAVSKGK